MHLFNWKFGRGARNLKNLVRSNTSHGKSTISLSVSSIKTPIYIVIKTPIFSAVRTSRRPPTTIWAKIIYFATTIIAVGYWGDYWWVSQRISKIRSQCVYNIVGWQLPAFRANINSSICGRPIAALSSGWCGTEVIIATIGSVATNERTCIGKAVTRSEAVTWERPVRSYVRILRSKGSTTGEP